MDINEAKVENLATWLYDDFHSVSIKGAPEITTVVVNELTSLLEDAGGIVCVISIKQILTSEAPAAALFSAMREKLRVMFQDIDDTGWVESGNGQNSLVEYESFRSCVEFVLERIKKRIFFFVTDFEACLGLDELDRLEILNKFMDLVDDGDEDFALGLAFISNLEIFEIQKGMGQIGSTLNDRLTGYVEEF